MASKALPALLLLALACGLLVTGGHAQAYIGGDGRGGSPAGMRPLPYPYARGGGSAAAGMQPPPYTNTRGEGSAAAGDDGTGGLSAVEEDKAFMINGARTPGSCSAHLQLVVHAVQPSWLTQED